MVFVVVDKIEGSFVFQAMFSNAPDALQFMLDHGYSDVIEVDLPMKGGESSASE